MSWLYTLIVTAMLFGSADQSLLNKSLDAAYELNKTEITVANQTVETEKIERTFQLNSNGKVSVSNINGNIEISGWDGSGVKLEAIKTADNKEDLAKLIVDIEATPQSVDIETEVERSGKRTVINSRNFRVDYKLSVPRGVELDGVQTVNGDVIVSELSGKIDAQTVNGTVRGRELSGEVELSAVNGEIDAKFASLNNVQKIDIEIVNGKVELGLPADSNATIKAESLNGNITNDLGVQVRKGRFVGRSLHARVGSGTTSVNLSSISGSLGITRSNNGGTQNPVTDLSTDDSANNMTINNGRTLNRAGVGRLDGEIAQALEESQRAVQEALADPKVRKDYEEAAKKGMMLAQVEMEKARKDMAKAQRELEKAGFDLKNMQMPPMPPMPPLAPMPEIAGFGMRYSPSLNRTTKSFSVNNKPKVKIEATGVNIRVKGWDKKEVAYSLSNVSNHSGGNLTVNDDQKGSTITIKIDGPPSPPAGRWRTNSTTLDIYVPKKADLKVSTDSEIRLDGVSGDIDLEGSTSSIDVRDSDGTLAIKTIDGRARVIGFSGDVTSNTVSGNVYLEGNLKTVNSTSESGDVVLTLPYNANASITSAGEVETAGMKFQKISDDEWKFGDGTAKMNFELATGRVVLRDPLIAAAN